MKIFPINNSGSGIREDGQLVVSDIDAARLLYGDAALGFCEEVQSVQVSQGLPYGDFLEMGQYKDPTLAELVLKTANLKKRTL